MLRSYSTTTDATDMDSKAKAPSVAQRSDHDIKKSSGNIEIPYSALNATDIKPTYEDLYQTVQNSKVSF